MPRASATSGCWAYRSWVQHNKLLEIAEKHGVTTVILSITNASSTLVRQVSDTVERAGLRLLVLPPVHELIGGRVRLSDIREVDVDDLLGRHQVATNVHEIAGYLTDRVVLVTGAGGSIGSELARQIHQYGPRELVLLDRDESALHAVQLSIYGQGLLDTPDIVLADIRDPERLDAVFAEHRPEVTFHAAALKHLPMLEQYPSEGWKTNVDGTLNVLRVAERYGCTRFVNISTDKAADPTSVLGSTKRLAERLTAWYAEALRPGVPLGPVRQRARQSRIGAAHLHPADRRGRSGHRHPPRHHPVLHDHPGGLRADHPGGGDRRSRRGAGARHGRTGPDPRRRQAAGRQGGPGGRDRLHRPADPARSCTRSWSATTRWV